MAVNIRVGLFFGTLTTLLLTSSISSILFKVSYKGAFDEQLLNG